MSVPTMNELSDTVTEAMRRFMSAKGELGGSLRSATMPVVHTQPRRWSSSVSRTFSPGLQRLLLQPRTPVGDRRQRIPQQPDRQHEQDRARAERDVAFGVHVDQKEHQRQAERESGADA